MANIEHAKYKDGADLYGILLTFCGLICMITAVLGIKFKWFKHRLNFESSLNEINPINSTTNDTAARPETFRSINTQYKATPYEVGVFRKRSDNEFDLERPKDLPPIRIKSSSVKLPKKPKNQQQSINTSNLTTQKQRETAGKLKFEAVSPSVHNSKSSSSNNKPNRSRSRSPKKDRHHQNKHIENKRNYEYRPANKTLLTSDLSEKQTIQVKEKLQQNLTQKSSNSNQMENKKNIKKKIKFENIPAKKDDPNSSHQYRRPTGFTKLSQAELNELEALSEQTSESPITIQTRRPTGFELLSKEELEELEELANNEENSIEKKFNTIQFHNIEENEPISNFKIENEYLRIREKEDEYGFISNDKKIESPIKNDLSNYPGVIEQENGQLMFKITGFSDNEDEDNDLYSKLKIKTKYDEDVSPDNNFQNQNISYDNIKPEPQPRTTLRQSKEEEETNVITSKMDHVSISFPSPPIATTSANIEENNTIKVEDEEDDSWSAVRNYRNITEEMAKHNQAIRDAAKEKAARRELRNPLAYDDMNNVASSKPKNMKDVKRRHHENEEREKKANQKVSLNNDNDEESEISC